MRIWIVGACLVCVHVPHAQAQEKDLEALGESERETLVTFIKAGRDAFEAGRYDKALRAFDEAYFIHPLTELLYRIAQCHERLGHASQAAEFYREYLKYKAEEGDGGDKIAEVEARIIELEQIKETELTIRTEPADARVLIGGQFAGRAPQTVTLGETSIELRVEAEGYVTLTQTVELEPGVQKELFLALQPEVTISQEPEGEKGLTPARKGGIGLMAGGGAVLIGGAVLAVIGTQSRASLEALDRTMPRPLDYNARYDRANFRSNLGFGLVGVGAVSAGVGAWLFFKPASETSKSASLELLPMLAPSHQGASVRLRF